MDVRPEFVYGLCNGFRAGKREFFYKAAFRVYVCDEDLGFRIFYIPKAVLYGPEHVILRNIIYSDVASAAAEEPDIVCIDGGLLQVRYLVFILDIFYGLQAVVVAANKKHFLAFFQKRSYHAFPVYVKYR